MNDGMSNFSVNDVGTLSNCWGGEEENKIQCIPNTLNQNKF